MSTDLGNISDYTINSYYGGDDEGVRVQITRTQNILPDNSGLIQLNLGQSIELVNILMGYIQREANRRQKLLADEIKHLKNMEKTVFHEVASLDPDLFQVPLLCAQIVADFAPKCLPTINSAEGGAG